MLSSAEVIWHPTECWLSKSNSKPMDGGNAVRPMPAPGHNRCRITSRKFVAQQDTPFMRRQTARPADEEMKFFTRELYLQFNSSDPQQADAADQKWERAITEYQQHLQRIKKELPEAAWKLSGLCLHDAESIDTTKSYSLSSTLGLIAVAQKAGEDLWKTYLLMYSLFSPIREIPASNWPLSQQGLHWLYDELDVSSTASDRFVHRVLFSDGSIVVVPFTDVGVRCLAMHASSLDDLMLQSA